MSDDETGYIARRSSEIDRPMLRLFRSYARDDAHLLILGMLLSVVGRVTSLVPVLVLGVTVDAVLLDTTAYELPGIPAAWVPATRLQQYFFSGKLILAAAVVTALTSYGQGLCLQAFAQRVQHNVRTDAYDSMQALEVGFFSTNESGTITSVLSNDVNRLRQFLTEGTNVGGRLLFTFAGIAGLMALVNPQLALVALLPAPVVAVFTYFFVDKVKPIYASVRSTVGRLNSRIETNLDGIETIKASNTEQAESDRVHEVSNDYLSENWAAIKYKVLFRPGLQSIGSLGFLTTFLVGGYWVLVGPPWLFTGNLTAGAFVIFVFYSQRLVWPMGQFGELVNLYHETQASVARILALLDRENGLDAGEGETFQIGRGNIQYQNVSFDYGRGSTDDEDGEPSEPVLTDVSLEIEGGSLAAFVGPTGAGKSTLAKLLLRFYDPVDGEILIDGQRLDDCTPETIRQVIGYVGQDSFLFPGTVFENIAYGRPDADRADVIEAAKTAQAHEFVTDLEDGYETEVGERGTRLSGGQRQRLSIARALLQEPRILVLDEATSDVDTETERAIRDRLEERTDRITTVSIAHRLSTVRNADSIFFLEDGSVVESGTHDELVRAGGRYADLWESQVGDTTVDGPAAEETATQ